ncbi:ABC transporter substrate-binding protein [Streptomyces sp. NPDC050560]|uniref:ABC transporter substrate-binding protein n=1 Tax=Streptomyces sp. NPDC050560 TaxID=3365630 RepID=UPI0037BAA156
MGTHRARRWPRLLAPAAALGLTAALAGCGAGTGSSGRTTVNWWTWDDRQAAAYRLCADAFEKTHPDIHVQISQYDSADYFTKLLSGFVADTAPDAFMNSVQYIQQYASLNQLMPLDDLMKRTGYDTDRFSVGVDDYKYTDGKQYGLPLDWASTALYYNSAKLKQAGLTEHDVDTMRWDPDGGGTFEKVVAHLTVDRNGTRGDQPGFDRRHVATYGINSMVTVGNDFNGLTTWRPLASSLGWRIGDRASYPTVFRYDDPRLKETFAFVRELTDKGYAPGPNEFSSAGNSASGAQLLGSGKIALYSGGSWEAATLATLPKLRIGTAPMVAGPDGTRGTVSNANGNVIWSGTDHPDETWAWVSYMGTARCQKTASRTGTFLPSIPSAVDTSAAAMKKQGVDLSVFQQQEKDKQLLPNTPYANGTALQTALLPLMQQYFAHQKGDGVFAQMTQESRKLLADKD